MTNTPVAREGPSPADRDYSISVLDCAAQILVSFLEPQAAEQSLHTVATRLDLNKSRAFRILATLERHGLVEHDQQSQHYRLGLKLLALGEGVRRNLNLLDAARPVLDRLARQTGETIYLGVVDGLEVVCVDKRESSYPIRLYAEVGRRAPLHAGGVPKVLLAYLHEHDPAILDRLPPADDIAAVVDLDALGEQLVGIRADGYAVVHDDLDWGSCSIAAPIRDHQGEVIAALSVAGPGERFTLDRRTHFVSLVREAGEQISAALGHHPAADA